MESENTAPPRADQKLADLIEAIKLLAGDVKTLIGRECPIHATERMEQEVRKEVLSSKDSLAKELQQSRELLAQQLAAIDSGLTKQVRAAKESAAQSLEALGSGLAREFQRTKESSTLQVGAAQDVLLKQILTARADGTQQLQATEINLEKDIQVCRESLSKEVQTAKELLTKDILAAGVPLTREIQSARESLNQRFEQTSVSLGKDIVALNERLLCAVRDITTEAHAANHRFEGALQSTEQRLTEELHEAKSILSKDAVLLEQRILENHKKIIEAVAALGSQGHNIDKSKEMLDELSAKVGGLSKELAVELRVGGNALKLILDKITFRSAALAMLFLLFLCTLYKGDSYMTAWNNGREPGQKKTAEWSQLREELSGYGATTKRVESASIKAEQSIANLVQQVSKTDMRLDAWQQNLKLCRESGAPTATLRSPRTSSVQVNVIGCCQEKKEVAPQTR